MSTETVEAMYYLVSAPPQSPSDDMNKIACTLSTTVAEAGLMIRFPSNAIWRQAKRPQPLEQIQEELATLGINTKILAAAAVFGLSNPEPVTSIATTEDGLICTLTNGGSTSLSFDKPVVCVQQQPKAFGSEYKRYRDKERAKKDKKKRQALNDNLAVLADAPNEILKGTSGKYDMRITLTQTQGASELSRVEIHPAAISYEFLKDRMATNLTENVVRFLQLLADSTPECVIKNGLIDIPVRYPMVVNPSFIQQMESHGFDKESFSPSMLMERLATLTALS